MSRTLPDDEPNGRSIARVQLPGMAHREASVKWTYFSVELTSGRVSVVIGPPSPGCPFSWERKNVYRRVVPNERADEREDPAEVLAQRERPGIMTA